MMEEDARYRLRWGVMEIDDPLWRPLQEKEEELKCKKCLKLKKENFPERVYIRLVGKICHEVFFCFYL